jgi:two-component system sensor histidine kinase YesM
MVRNIFKRAYRRLFGEKFFNKLFITYMIVVIVVLLVFSFTISSSISNQLQEEYSYNNRQAVYAMQNYLQERIDTVNAIVGKIYDDNHTYETVFGLPVSENGNYDTPAGKQNLSDVLEDLSGIDEDINDIVLFRNSMESLYLYRKYDSYLYKDPELIKKYYQLKYDFDKKKFVSRHLFKGSDNKKIYTYGIINNLIDPQTGEIYSKIMVNFNINALEKLYGSYKKHVKGYIMILTDDGTAIFDSSGKYYSKIYPYLDIIKKSAGFLTLEEESFADVIKSEKYGITFLSVIPKIEVTRNIMALRARMLVISMLCILFVIILYFFATIIFSRRVKIIIDVMKNVGNNNLTPRIPVKNENDEIGLISVIFNKMCDNLQKYITKVYISEIKQKSAELKALQTQINPHFLYNTLEAIRMGLNRKGNEDAADMIYYLAELFRISLRSDTIVTLKDELKYCRTYLELFSIRYGDKLKVCFDVPEHLESYGVIKLLLQPIVENYIMHGFSWEKDTNSITIKGSIDENDIIIVVSDNGNGIEEDKLEAIMEELGKFEANTGESIGLKNVNDRIKLVYGLEYGLNINSTYGKGTDISIKIPAKSKNELKEIMQPQ